MLKNYEMLDLIRRKGGLSLEQKVDLLWQLQDSEENVENFIGSIQNFEIDIMNSIHLGKGCNDIKLIDKALERSDVNRKILGSTILSVFSFDSRIDYAVYHHLLKKGANPNMVDDYLYRGYSSLDGAISTNRPKLVKMLLAYGAKTLNCNGKPVKDVVDFGNFEMFNLLRPYIGLKEKKDLLKNLEFEANFEGVEKIRQALITDTSVIIACHN